MRISPHVRFVIPSRGREKIIRERALSLVPDALVSVAESEFDAYAREIGPERLIAHPDDVTGIAPNFQWILDNVPDPTVMIISDDVFACYDQTGYRKRRIRDPQHVQAVLERTAIVSREAGARVFGFATYSRPTGYFPGEPVKLSTWVDCLIGIHGREVRYDVGLRLRADIDFCLKSLMRDRILWSDQRYVFGVDRFGKLPGGNSAERSAERHEQEIQRLKARWGRHLVVGSTKSQVQIKLDVPRRSF